MKTATVADVGSPWLRMDEAGTHLRYEGPRRGEMARQFCRRHGIPVQRRGGRVLLVRKAAIDAFLDSGVAPRRRRSG